MAGHKGAINLDPAYLKYGDRNKYRYKYFRLTPRTAWITTVYMVIVPGILGYIGYKTDMKYDMRGKKRGEPITQY